MTVAYLTRARLRSSASVEALSSLMISRGRLAPLSGKALVWSLFADNRNRARDFLWRLDETRPGRLTGEFFILSERLPQDTHRLFEIETKEFSPNLAQGDRLAFRLRANPVVRRRAVPDGPSRKHDVVMHALRADGASVARASRRQSALQIAAGRWLARQLSKAGAELEPEHLVVDGYRQVELPGTGGPTVRFSTVDFDGLLTVSDPRKLIEAILAGFGASKAYGCGLMLIRRAG